MKSQSLDNQLIEVLNEGILTNMMIIKEEFLPFSETLEIETQPKNDVFICPWDNVNGDLILFI
jgi:hypothetical protein